MESHEDQVISLLDKIKILFYDKEKFIGRVGELRGLITPKLDTMFIALKESQDALGSKDLTDLRSAEMWSYLFSGLISMLECLKKGWDNHLKSLKNTFSDIFKFF